MSKKNDINFIEIGKRLRKARKSLDLTLKDMSEMSGFVVSSVSEMELGKKRLLPEYLYLLSTKFNLNLNWLFNGKGSMFMPGYDLKWDFGKDNEQVRDFIFLLENSSYFRHEILRYSMRIMERDKKFIEDSIPMKKKKE